MDQLVYHMDWPVPEISDTEVLIKVHAFGLNNTYVNTCTAWYSKGMEENTSGGGFDSAYDLGNYDHATLGHSGQPLRLDLPTVLFFILVNLAAFTRVGTLYLGGDLQPSFTVTAAVLWSLSFGLYGLVYGRHLWKPRRAEPALSFAV